ncbi:MAG: hypothetical protein KC462_03615 [Cyanobacteria bacterium HKST-UBA05]|nr:hypothetical protein [Cyanobacteria bacterium HKST-UBA05]
MPPIQSISGATAPLFSVTNQTVQAVRQTTSQIGAQKLAGDIRTNFWTSAVMGLGLSVGLGVGLGYLLGGVITAIAATAFAPLLVVGAVAAVGLLAYQGYGLISKWGKMSEDLKKFEENPNGSGLDPNQMMAENRAYGFECGMWLGSVIPMAWGAATALKAGVGKGAASIAGQAAKNASDDAILATADDAVRVAADDATMLGNIRNLVANQVDDVARVSENAVVKAVDDIIDDTALAAHKAVIREFDSAAEKAFGDELARLKTLVQVGGEGADDAAASVARLQTQGGRTEWVNNWKTANAGGENFPNVRQAEAALESYKTALREGADPAIIARQKEMFAAQLRGMNDNMLKAIANCDAHDAAAVARAAGFPPDKMSPTLARWLQGQARERVSQLAQSRWAHVGRSLHNHYSRTTNPVAEYGLMGSAGDAGNTLINGDHSLFGWSRESQQLMNELNMAQQQQAQTEAQVRNQNYMNPTNFGTESSFVVG